MASYSLQELLGWMKDTSQLYEWDTLLALSGHALNGALKDQHAIRLSLGSNINSISGHYDIPDTPGVSVTHHLNECSLSYPTLSFSGASYVSDNTTLSLQMNSGQKVVTYDNAVRSLSRYSPLNGPWLQSANQPVAFEAKRDQQAARVVCNLAEEGATFKLMDSLTQNEQEAGGAFFQQRFQALGERAVYPLASFPDSDNPFMVVKDVEVGSQSVDPGSEDGALLLYTTMQHGRAGNKPSNGSGYKYLIPNDTDQDYGFAAQFSSKLINRAAFGGAILQTFGADAFEFIDDGTGRATGIKATGGSLAIPASSDYKDDLYEYRSDAFQLSVASSDQPLTVDFEDHRAAQHWRTRATLTLGYRPWASGTSWTTHTAEFLLTLEQVFQMVADEFAGGEVGGEVFVPQTRTPEITPISGLPSNLPQSLRQRILAFVEHLVKTAVLEQYSQTLTTKSSENFLGATAVADNTVLQPSAIALPFDYAAFGVRGNFAITPAHPIVLAGQRLEFAAEPERSVIFSLDNLDATNPGTIDQQGNYRAPPLHTLDGPFAQVLLIAQDTQSGETSATVITVLGQALAVSSDIQVCNQGRSVELSARSISGGPLQWRIKQPVPGESGALEPDETSQRCTYIAADQVANKTYVLDEIEVTDSDSGQAVSSHILALQRTPSLTLSPDWESSVEGQLQLRAFANGNQIDDVQWTLEFNGPGTLGATGLYTEDTAASASFALITAVYNHEILGSFQGYFILPLPLANAQAVFQPLRR